MLLILNDDARGHPVIHGGITEVGNYSGFSESASRLDVTVYVEAKYWDPSVPNSGDMTV